MARFHRIRLVEGVPSQTNLQMDEVSFPIFLAWELKRSDDLIWNGVLKSDLAEFLTRL